MPHATFPQQEIQGIMISRNMSTVKVRNESGKREKLHEQVQHHESAWNMDAAQPLHSSPRERQSQLAHCSKRSSKYSNASAASVLSTWGHLGGTDTPHAYHTLNHLTLETLLKRVYSETWTQQKPSRQRQLTLRPPGWLMWVSRAVFNSRGKWPRFNILPTRPVTGQSKLRATPAWLCKTQETIGIFNSSPRQTTKLANNNECSNVSTFSKTKKRRPPAMRQDAAGSFRYHWIIKRV